MNVVPAALHIAGAPGLVQFLRNAPGKLLNSPVGLFGRSILILLGSGGASLEFVLQYLNWTVVIGALWIVLNMVLGKGAQRSGSWTV